MTTPDPRPASARATLARSVTATGWYTIGSVLLFFVAVLFVWGLATVAASDRSASMWVLFAAGGILTLLGVTMLLLRYRPGGVDAGDRLPLAWLVVLVAGGVALGAASASVLLAASVASTSVFVMRWSAGLRIRLATAVTLVLVVLAWIEMPGLGGFGGLEGEAALLCALFAVLLPVSTSFTVWWWDVVLELDRARETEARLSAAQERLRLANDVHDLQGHHLQVIALQLELADRMLPRDPSAAAEQVRLARAAVDDARRGTRELAARFRGVPLADELANAADLLRAAGLEVRLDVTAESADAPADVLGPIVRECTTNVLAHGGGRRALLGLARTERGWTLRVVNDVASAASATAASAIDEAASGGSGLAGIAARAAAVGGTSRVGVVGDEFEVVVTVAHGAVTA